jgi:hypothetical protein
LAIIKDITGTFRRRFSNLHSDNPPNIPGLDTVLLRALSGRMEIVAFTLSRPSGLIKTTLILSLEQQETGGVEELWSRPDLQAKMPCPMIDDETGYFLNLTNTLEPLRSAK